MQGLARIDELLQKGKFTKAIDGLRELLSHAPEDPELRARLADAYRLAENNERALYHFQKAATLYRQSKQPLRAASILEKANHIQPNEPEVLYRWAEDLAAAGQGEKLRAVSRRLVSVARAPGDRRRLWALRVLLEGEPANPILLMENLVALAETKKFEEAIEHANNLGGVALDPRQLPSFLAAAAAAAPEEPDVGAALARLGRRHGNARAALALLVPYYETFPEHVGVLETLTQLLEALGAHHKAHVARIELVKLRARSGDRGPALAEIRALISTEPPDPVAIEVCALACISFGLQGEATRLWFQLAQIHAAASNLAGRDEALRRVLELRPDDVAALGWAAEVLRERGKDQDARLLERRRADLLARQNPVSEELPDADSAPVRPVSELSQPSGVFQDTGPIPTDGHSASDWPTHARPVDLPPPGYAPTPVAPSTLPSQGDVTFQREHTLGIEDHDVVSVEAAFESLNSQSGGDHEGLPINANPWMDETADEVPEPVFMTYGEDSRSEVSLATRLIPFGTDDIDYVEETES